MNSDRLSTILGYLFIFFVAIYIFAIVENENSIKESMADSFQNIINKNVEIRTCMYEIQSYFNTGRYVQIHQNINPCREKINEIRAEIEQIEKREVNETTKREYKAMMLDYQGGVLALDIIQNSADILSGELSEDEIKDKARVNKILIEQVLEILDKLENEYSDTYFFEINYNSSEGSMQLGTVRKTYKDALIQYEKTVN